MKVIDGTIASPLGFSADGLHAGFKKRKWILVGLSLKNQPVLQVFTRPIRYCSSSNCDQDLS